MMDDRPMGELLAHLEARGLVSRADLDRIAGRLSEAEPASDDPVYLRVLSGIGAWAAAVFLLAFLGISRILENGTGATVCGSLFLAAAIALSRASRGNFLSQLSLALAFAGNVLVLVGVAEGFRMRGIAPVLVTHAVVCAVVYPLYANGIYRFLAPTALAALATAWIVEEKHFAFMHALVAAEMLLVGLLFLRKKRPPLLTPLAYSAAAALPATLLFMNLTQVNVWGAKSAEPIWPSSALLGAGMIYLYLHLAGGPRRLREPWLILAIASTALLGLFTTPGILVAVGLLVLGYAYGDSILTAMSCLFLPCFLVFFYYALDIDLAHKSWVVAGSGLLLLVARWVAGLCRPEETAP